MSDDTMLIAAVGVRRWTVGVSQIPGRWVCLALEFPEATERDPLSLTFDPRDARQVGEALIHYAELAELRAQSEMN